MARLVNRIPMPLSLFVLVHAAACTVTTTQGERGGRGGAGARPVASGDAAATDAGQPVDADGGVGDSGPPGCVQGQTLCGAACTDLTTDSANCGTCGNPCPSGLACAEGSCCPAPTILCGSQCLDPTADDANCGSCGHQCSVGQHCARSVCQESKIQHVVLIVQENHTFETYFGMYCQAAAGSNPVCTTGPACCEGAPIVAGQYTEPHGATAYRLDDDPGNRASNFASDRDHAQACETQQIHNGAMDQFVTGSTGADTCLSVGPSCANPLNWVLANGSTAADTVNYYWTLADRSALADRYFQPIAGGTASNNMYFAGAHYRFLNNDKLPDVAVGTSSSGLCAVPSPCSTSQRTTYALDTIASLLLDSGKTFLAYADGYQEAYDAAIAGQQCPAPASISECPYKSCLDHPIACNACVYDPSDVPFLYYARFTDTPVTSGRLPTPYVKDYAALQADLAAGTLPNFSYVKARLYHNEHPNVSTIADGISIVQATIDMIEQSQFQSSTLILLTWDEGGGFFDHISPPTSPPTTVDSDAFGEALPYGTRVPFLVVGHFARTGTISHVVMEHSSIVKFLEYNFLGPVGQLGARDGWVNNIGGLLDPSTTGIPIPEN